MYSLDPRDHSWVSNSTIFSWRQYLKSEILRQRLYRSDYSGVRLNAAEMHEGILTRANVPKSVWWHFYIYHPYNCFVLTPDEHRQYGHQREWAVQRAYTRYGRDAVREWYYSLPWKARPPFELT